MIDYQSVRVFWQKQTQNSLPSLDVLLDNYRILFAYHSGKIENSEITYHDTREIFENGQVLNYTGSPRAIFELQNQKTCYEFLQSKIAGREPLSISLIKEVHAILTAGTYDERRFIENGERPGEFKKHDYVTGLHEAGFPPEDVEAELQDLVSELNELKQGDFLKAASYFHARFENIHPFSDGNGRVGRTMLNFFLLTHGEPPLVVFNDDKKIYYAALELYDAEEHIEPLYEFFKIQTVKTWQQRIEKAQGDRPAARKSFEDLT